jgi:hypothetical protein
MVSLYKQKSNNNYMNVCVNCIEYKKEIDILSAKVVCIEYDNEELKKENQELKKEIQEHKKRIASLEKENKELKKENEKLKLRITILEFDKIKYKIITALQDINSLHCLEKIIIIKKSLFKLRKYRNNYNHYIDEDSDDYEISCKQLYLLYRLKILTNEEKNIINLIFTTDENLTGSVVTMHGAESASR